MALDPLTMAAVAGVSSGIKLWGQGEARGAAQKAGRTANKARVEAGKAQVRLLWDDIATNYKQSIDAIEILKRNTRGQIDLAEAEALRSWGFAEQLRFDDYRRDAAAYNQSVEDYYTNLNFNDISANMAYEEEKQRMDEFHSKQAFERRDDILKHEEILRSDITSRIGLRRQQEGFRAKAAFEDQKDIIQGLMVAGKIRSTGAVGRSARKAVQVAAMDVGSRQAMRADILQNSESVYYNEMRKLSDVRYLAKKQRNLNIDKRADSLMRMLKASTLRKDRIAAGKYSADLQAKRGILSEPELGRMTPIPFEAFRPEFQMPTKPDKEKFYEDHMPHLEDENKIYGDRGAGAPVSPWMQAASVGVDMLGAYAKAGGDFNAATGPGV